jgi:hypothetical protein
MIVVPITIRRRAPGSDCNTRFRITEAVLWVTFINLVKAHLPSAESRGIPQLRWLAPKHLAVINV